MSLKPAPSSPSRLPARDAAIVEMQRRGVGSPPTHFLQRRARQPRRRAFDQQQADAAGPRPAGADRGGDVIGAHAGGDESLLAVDHVAIAVAPRDGPQIGDVGAAARLGDGERGNLLARKDFRQHAGFEFGAAGARDRRRTDRMAVEAGADAAGTGPRQLLHRDDPHEAVGLGPAVRLGKSEPEQADLCRLLVERAGKLAGLVPDMRVGLDLAFDKAAHRVAERDVVGGVKWAFAQASHSATSARRNICDRIRQDRKPDVRRADKCSPRRWTQKAPLTTAQRAAAATRWRRR